MSGSCPQFAFDVAFHVDVSIAAEKSIELLTTFTDFLGERGLTCSGGAEGDAQYRYIIWREGSQAEHADREAVRAWAEGRSEMSEVMVGDLIDGDFSSS